MADENEEETTESVLPPFVFLPNLMRHINLSQIVSVSASPPRRNSEDDFSAHIKGKKKVELYTKWGCTLDMADGKSFNLHGEEARLFLELIEQLSVPLRVPVESVKPTSE